MKQDEHIYSLRDYLLVYGALMVLLTTTAVVSRFDLGVGNPVIALVIGASKAILIVLFFMNARFAHPVAKVFAGVGFFWLGILLILTMNDYVSRGWVPSANE